MILSYYARYARGYIPLDVNSTSGRVHLEIALALAVTVEPFYPGPDGKVPEGAAALALGKALIEGQGGRMRVLYRTSRFRLKAGKQRTASGIAVGSCYDNTVTISHSIDQDHPCPCSLPMRLSQGILSPLQNIY